jgi:hypothetical protein
VIRSLGGSVTRVASHGHADRHVDIAPVLAHFDAPAQQASWARLLATPSSSEFETWLAPYLDGLDLVVGFELPNIVLQALIALEIPVIDIAFSPIRFLDDLCFDVRCSDKGLADTLAPLRITDDEILRNLSQIFGSVHRRTDTLDTVAALGRAGILLGQTKVDASLVEAGVVRQIGDYEDRIVDWARGFDTVILKPHPYGSHDLALKKLVQSGVRLVSTSSSPYQLFACDNVVSAAAISSGSLTEARWFGVETLQFLQPLRSQQRGHSVDPVSSALFTAPVWRALLAGGELPDDPPRLPGIRAQVNSDWGYDPRYPAPVFRPVPPVSLPERLRSWFGSKAR